MPIKSRSENVSYSKKWQKAVFGQAHMRPHFFSFCKVVDNQISFKLKKKLMTYGDVRLVFLNFSIPRLRRLKK